MKQVPTNATMHSLSSLSKADLSIYDSVDDQVLSDYAVSTLFSTVSKGDPNRFKPVWIRDFLRFILIKAIED